MAYGLPISVVVLIAVASARELLGAGTLLGIIGIIRGVMGKPGLVPSAIAAVAGIVILAVPVSNALGGGAVPPLPGGCCSNHSLL